MRRRARKERQEGKKDIRRRFKELCGLFGYARKYIPSDQRHARALLIGELRSLLAATCMQALEPDIIILDEFQRFKHLLQGDTPASQLARALFDYSDEASSARVILLGLIDMESGTVSEKVTRAMVGAVTLRTATLTVDDIRPAPEHSSVSLQKRRMRIRFAARLADERTDEGREAARADQVRQAFNSPFWPFVLVTTYIGQEGLDFHPYCHAVVHWNLPSNPVDLEQREGRVHR